MKVIFLDVDGVLNCEEAFVRANRDDAVSIGSCVLDTMCLLRFLNLWRRAGKPRVVLSSTWREVQTPLRVVCATLFAYGVHVHDTTPIRRGSPSLRGMEIRDWLNEQEGEEVEAFVILDDESFDFEAQVLSDHHVKPSFQGGGLLDEHVEAALRILSR